MNIKVGDFVKVKKGVKDPEFPKVSFDDWQGEVTEINEDGSIIIELDYTSLAQISDEYLIQLAIGGSDWWVSYFFENDLEKTDQREEEEDEQLLEELRGKYYWCSIFEERGLFLYEQFKGVDTEDRDEVLEEWKRYLTKNLKMPFVVSSDGDIRGGLRYDERLKVHHFMTDYDNVDQYGILACDKQDSTQYPLFDLEVLDKNSPNYQMVEDYRTWFANY